MWYFPHGEEIIRGGEQGGVFDHGPITRTEDGREWYAFEAETTEEIVSQHRIGGGFGDRGGWYSWRRLCSAHESYFTP